MRLFASKKFNLMSVGFIAATLLCSNVWAQSNQYTRKEKPAAKVDPAAKPGKDAPAKKATNEKLDIENLEKRYWAPKDTEFKVVQNRKFKKAGRYNLTVMGGILFNDPFISGSNLSLSTAYYTDEHHGYELRYETFSHSLGEAGEQVIAKGGRPDVNFEKSYFGANYSWIPFYGKISVLDEKIIYFDMAINAGIGMLTYEQQTQTAGLGQTKSTPALSLGVTQQYFIQDWWALRLDVRSRFYKESRVRAVDGFSLGTKSQTNTYIMFGATFFFGQ